ncbi:IMPACT family protein [Flavobacterium selenitireducens]|uniref:IMPACT family protein n=1 Tax=Flavobacterium selenitireducens TaxID=2722704 RepID=UPI00168AF41E|nr:YigZ family protein [Flavobacterium selenitireducens]MBD3582732.1 YigZ family protein [Flavobacterium selenitireducens]
MNDTYKTISAPSGETLYKEKGSKFFGYAFPVVSEDEVKQHLENLRKQHSGAVHFCYAFQIGTEKTYYRANDDGEPSNSAGMPIYGQLQSFGLTNVLIVSVRFFGGVKLGVGGLISAYRTSAQMALEVSDIVEKTIDLHYKVAFEYKDINKVMRIIREKNLNVISQRMELDCEIEFTVRKRNAPEAVGAFDAVFWISVSEV